MNFEFMKDLEYLEKVYTSCVNAEELVLSKPDLSIISSRKSAETLAKFIYLVATTESVCMLSFADILSAPVVKRYINNTEVQDAFHFIRKNGNVAVHTLECGSADTSIAVLERLHFITGEIAKRMNLVSSYPKFDKTFVSCDDVQAKDINIDAVAQKMYDDYIRSKSRVDRLLSEFSELCSPIQIVPGEVDLNESIEFEHKPIHKSTITYIQEHFAFLALQALKAQNDTQINNEIKYFAELTIYGKNEYKTTDLFAFVNGLMHDLPSAEGFKIISIYNGPSVAHWFNDEVREEFRKTVDTLGKTEQFTYSIFEFLYNHGMGGCSKFKNGKWIDIESQYSSSITDQKFESDWWCWNLDLCIDFDFTKYTDVLDALHEVVRKHIPKDQIAYCEDAWDGGDLEILINSITWCPKTLRVVQDFLDEVNKIIDPIKSECKGWSGDCGWYQVNAPFAVANWIWTEEGFKIQGISL